MIKKLTLLLFIIASTSCGIKQKPKFIKVDSIKLINANLDKEVFNRREFYRLQQIEYLHKTEQIDNDLLWSK